MRSWCVFAASVALVAADMAVPEWIHLVPFGRWAKRGPGGGDLVVGQSQAEQLVANFRANGVPLAIDWEHQSLLARDNGQPAPAAGWISEVQIRADGVWGRVQWTERAAEQLRRGEYRYFSPVILFNRADRRTGKPSGFAFGPGALTNDPFFSGDLTPVLSFSAGGSDMSLLAFVISALGLPEDTSEEAARTALEERLVSRDAMYTAASEAMGWSAPPADAPAQLKARLAASNDIDPEEHLRVVTELASLKASGGQVDLVARGREMGKITPANEAAFKVFLKAKGYAAAAAWLDVAPITIPLEPQVKRPPTPPKAGKLTAEEAAACKAMGLTEAEFLAAKA